MDIENNKYEQQAKMLIKLAQNRKLLEEVLRLDPLIRIRISEEDDVFSVVLFARLYFSFGAILFIFTIWLFPMMTELFCLGLKVIFPSITEETITTSMEPLVILFLIVITKEIILIILTRKFEDNYLTNCFAKALSIIVFLLGCVCYPYPVKVILVCLVLSITWFVKELLFSKQAKEDIYNCLAYFAKYYAWNTDKND
jgi:hypothetical protein